MKHNPYAEIIDLELEQKEYAKLCNGESETYLHYSDWEEHIKDRLMKFQSNKDLYGFKRFCLNLSRSVDQTPNMFLSYVILLTTVFIDGFLSELPFIIPCFVIVFLIGYMIRKNKEVNCCRYFCCYVQLYL